MEAAELLMLVCYLGKGIEEGSSAWGRQIRLHPNKFKEALYSV